MASMHSWLCSGSPETGTPTTSSGLALSKGATTQLAGTAATV